MRWSRCAAKVAESIPTRATMVPLREGLAAESQNHWPSLELDLGAVVNLLAPILPAGFYYKTFMWPRAFWKNVYEPAIRAAAGLGRAPELPDPDRYEHRHAHCEVLIAGGGRAGLQAALEAAATGQRVIVADENAEWGGRSLPHEVKGLLAQLLDKRNVTLLLRTTVFGVFGHNHVGMLEHCENGPRQRLWQVRAGEIVAATGAHERPLVFDGNDRPGILLADSARLYALKYGVAPGRQVVVATCGDSAYGAARDMVNAGVKVTTLIDLPHGPERATRFRAADARRRSAVGPRHPRHARSQAHLRRARVRKNHRVRLPGHARRLDARGAPLFAGARQAALR